MERGGKHRARLDIGPTMLNQLFCGRSRGVMGELIATPLPHPSLSAKKHFVGDIPPVAKLEGNFFSLHLQDLALACGCAQGNSAPGIFRRNLSRLPALGRRHYSALSSGLPGGQGMGAPFFGRTLRISEGANRRSFSVTSTGKVSRTGFA